MNEKLISGLVFVSVLLVAGIGLYIAFSAGAPSEGRTIEGAKQFYKAHQPYQFGNLYMLAERIRSAPREEMPAAELYNRGFCVLMFNPRSAGVVPVPVGRSIARSAEQSDTVQMMLDRDWVIIDVVQARGDRLCPPHDEIPTLRELMMEYES